MFPVKRTAGDRVKTRLTTTALGRATKWSTAVSSEKAGSGRSLPPVRDCRCTAIPRPYYAFTRIERRSIYDAGPLPEPCCMNHLVPQSVRSPFKVGTIIAGRYSVRGSLGSGSMGWVLKVADMALNGELVALKVLYPHLLQDETVLGRFRQEVVLTRQLSHPAIVHVHDFEENQNDHTFLAMEYIRGTTLAELLIERNGKGLPFDEALLILTRIAEGLLYAHQQGVLHRDLKPSNILIGQDGQVRLCDFGIAKSLQTELGLTRTGETLGTPYYMAPEQFRSAEIDQRTDIYSFGILAYELVVGHPPFATDDFFALADQHLKEPLPSLNGRGVSVPIWFEELVHRCCAKERKDRPLSIAEFLPQLQKELPQATVLKFRPPRSHARRRLSPRARRVLNGVITVLVSWGLFEASYAQTDFRIWLMSRVFITEKGLNRELPWLKKFLRMRASLLRPESAFELITMAAEHKARDKHQLAAMILADQMTLDPLGTQRTALGDIKDPAGFTLFQRAAALNMGDMVEGFDGFTFNAESVDPNGETPLTAAMHAQARDALVQIISLKHGGIDRPNAKLDTPMQIAIAAKDDEIVRLLRYTPVDISPRNANGLTALHIAASVGDLEAMVLLVERYTNFDLRDFAGRTPLMSAVLREGEEKDALEFVGVLLFGYRQPPGKHGPGQITIDVRDNDGKTALMHAAIAKRGQVYRMLERAGADASLRDLNGRTAADYAAENGLFAAPGSGGSNPTRAEKQP